ncbi:MAG: type IV secretion system protein [Treponema sp.]|jgi:type IV secretory pathway TrbF-like protein|nr:type IV secretion system protein [Treponema sp.]
MTPKWGKAGETVKKISAAQYYELARRTWDERTAHTVGRIRFLQAVILLLLAVLCTETWYILTSISKPRMIPYVVEIADNEVRFAGFIQNRQLKASDAEIIFYLKRFITGLFTITSDPVLLKDRLADVYNFTGPAAQIQVTEFILENRPVEKAAAGIRIDIRFSLFEKLSEHTWRCEWLEETREKGILKGQAIKSGTFTYTQEYPQDDLQAETNPSGVFFTEYFVTERR